MNNKKILAFAVLAASAVGTQAQSAGTWFGTIGATRIAPNVSSGTLSPPAPPGTTVDIGADTQPVLSVGRMLTDHWSVELWVRNLTDQFYYVGAFSPPLQNDYVIFPSEPRTYGVTLKALWYKQAVLKTARAGAKAPALCFCALDALSRG